MAPSNAEWKPQDEVRNVAGLRDEQRHSVSDATGHTLSDAGIAARLPVTLNPHGSVHLGGTARFFMKRRGRCDFKQRKSRDEIFFFSRRRSVGNASI